MVVPAYVAETCSVAAVVGCGHQQIGKLNQVGLFQIFFISLQRMIEQGMIGGQVHVSENKIRPIPETGVIVASDGKRLAGESRLEFAPEPLRFFRSYFSR